MNRDEINQNVCVAISAAITSYGRIFMSQFLADPDITIYYTDTDSVWVDKPLDPSVVGKGLGLFKLEHFAKEAVFIAPKVYGALILNEETNSISELVKVKGYKGDLSYDVLRTVLNKNKKKRKIREKRSI